MILGQDEPWSSSVPPEPDDALKLLAERSLAEAPAKFWLRFPAALEARFEADTRRERSRAWSWFSLLSALVMLLMYPTLLCAVPDMRVASGCWYLRLCIPGSTVCSRDPAV